MASFASGYAQHEIPPFERLYLGQVKQTCAGSIPCTVTPVAFIPVASTTAVSFLDPQHLDASGNPLVRAMNIPTLSYQIAFPGGDTEGVFNSEYRIPIAGPVSMSLFNDIGAVGALQRDQLAISSAGLQNITSQLPGTSVSNTLGLQSGTNFRARDSAGIEFVIQLPIINAPFRLYYAFNLLRLSQQIIAPPSVFNSGIFISQVSPEVFILVIQPQLANTLANPQRVNFFEPRSTFRFTVSRTLLDESMDNIQRWGR